MNNIIEIVNKIKKDPKKLKRLIEIEKIEELYQLFRENGYAYDFEYFRVEIMYILETSGLVLKNSESDNTSGGKSLKINLTKGLSTSMASLMTLSSPYGSSKIQAKSMRDHFLETKNNVYYNLRSIDGDDIIETGKCIAGLGIGVTAIGVVPCTIGYLIYKSIRDGKRRMVELAEHRRKMSVVLQRIKIICYDMELYYEKLLDIAKIEPAVKGLLDQCIACLYYFTEEFFDGEVPYIIRSKNVSKEYKKRYIYDSQRYTVYINNCAECAQKYRELANRYNQVKECDYDYTPYYPQYPTSAMDGVSVNVNMHDPQSSGAVQFDNNIIVVNNINPPCDREECDKWANLIEQVIELANCIMRCERSSPIPFKYIAPPPPPKLQTLSPGVQSGGRNFSRY